MFDFALKKSFKVCLFVCERDISKMVNGGLQSQVMRGVLLRDRVCFASL